MKNIKIILTAILMGAIGFADAQYYPSSPPPGYGPPPRRSQPQEEEPDYTQPSGYFEVSIGLTQPLGYFANNTGMGYGGYALPGDNVSIALALPIEHSNFGVAFMYSGADNYYDLNTYGSNFQATDQQGRQFDFNDSYASDYNESFILAGLFATYPVHHLSFDFRLLGGVAICNLPIVDAFAYPTSSTAVTKFEWDTPGSISSSFATDIGIGIRYKFRRISLMLGIDYLEADPLVNVEQQYTDQSGTISYTHIGGGVPISLMSYNIGFGYQIN